MLKPGPAGNARANSQFDSIDMGPLLTEGTTRVSTRFLLKRDGRRIGKGMAFSFERVQALLELSEIDVRA
jgi:hypothetical protein